MREKFHGNQMKIFPSKICLKKKKIASHRSLSGFKKKFQRMHILNFVNAQTTKKKKKKKNPLNVFTNAHKIIEKSEF